MSEQKKRARGRPSKLTPEVTSELVKYLGAGNFRSTSCAAVGVAYQTFLVWMMKGKTARRGRYRELFDAVTKAEATTEVIQVARVLKASEKDPKHAKWWLTHGAAGKRWAVNKPQKIELTGKDGGPLEIADARDELAKKLDQLDAKRAGAQKALEASTDPKVRDVEQLDDAGDDETES